MWCALVLATLDAPALADTPNRREALQRTLATIRGADRGEVVPVVDEAVAAAFADDVFYTLRFRQYPVAVTPPEPLRPNTLFVVRVDGSVQRFVGAHALEVFFKMNLRPVTSDAEAKQAAKAWLRLVGELRQDGFFQFSIPDDAVLVVSSANGQRRVTGQAHVVPEAGNQGHIAASLTFGATGKLNAAAESTAIKPGIRPVCQATKLLDPDPIVRRMAEQDVLVMG